MLNYVVLALAGTSVVAAAPTNNMGMMNSTMARRQLNGGLNTTNIVGGATDTVGTLIIPFTSQSENTC